MKHKLLLIYSWFIRTLFYFFPDIPFFMKIRGFFYGLGMKKCGKNFQVTHSVILNSLENFIVENNIYIANNCNFIATACIVIKDNVIFGPSVVMASGNHSFLDNSFRYGKPIPKKIVIEEGCWIASNTTIVAGSRVPRFSIVGAGSVYNIAEPESEKALYSGVPSTLKKNL